jgi:hypothetical protein
MWVVRSSFNSGGFPFETNAEAWRSIPIKFGSQLKEEVSSKRLHCCNYFSVGFLVAIYVKTPCILRGSFNLPGIIMDCDELGSNIFGVSFTIIPL